MRKAKFMVSLQQTYNTVKKAGGTVSGKDSDATVKYGYDSKTVEAYDYDLDEVGSIKCEPVTGPVTCVKLAKIR